MLGGVPRFVFALALLAAGCSGGETRAGDDSRQLEAARSQGDSLAEIAGSTYRVRRVAALGLGQEFALMWESIRNASEKPLMIRRIEPIYGRDRNVARDVQITLSARRSTSLPFGLYYMYPPALRDGDECLVERVAPARGYVLQPSHAPTEGRVALVIRGRTAVPGVFRLRGQRIVYEQDGRLFYEDIPFGVRIEVRRGAQPDIPAEQHACL